MPLERNNPISIQVLGSLSTPDRQEAIDELIGRIEAADEASTDWLDKQRKLIKLRFGPRDKRKVPWEGAHNISVPLTDSIARRFLPGIAALFLDSNPVAFFSSPDPADFQVGRQAEPFFHWMTREQMQMDPEVIRLVALYRDRGHAYAREGWNYKTQRFTRIVRAEELFPTGIQNFIEQAQAAHQQTNPTGQFIPADAVIQVLEREYQLSIDDEFEAQQLADAAQGLLAGRPYMRLTFQSVAKDQADWRGLDPINVIVDQDSPNVEDADFFVTLHRMTPDSIQRRVRDGIFEPVAAAEVVEYIRNVKDDAQTTTDSPGDTLRQQITDLLDRRSGNRQRSAQDITTRSRVWQIFAKLDLDGDGVTERYVIWYHPGSKTVLAWTDYPFPFDQWPITLFKFEEHADRPIDSRGIPELLFDLQKLVNAQHNARLDAGQILLSPAMQVRNSAVSMEQLVKWRPGAIYPVTQVGDIAPIAHDLRLLGELLREEQVTQRLAESYIGTFDATINQLQQSTERRTAAEVNAITQLASNVFGLDARMFQFNMGRSLSKVWDLYVEFGPPELHFRIMGEERPRLARKRDIARRFDIKPAGTPASTNRAVMLANAERAIGLILQDTSGRFDGGELVRHWLQLLDINLANKVVRDQDEQAAAQIVNQAAGISAERAGIEEAPFI